MRKRPPRHADPFAGASVPGRSVTGTSYWNTSSITAAVGILGAVVAWADGQIDNVSLLAAVWAAAQACFIRAGIANEAQMQADDL